jgi:hypothetical protein
MPPLFLRYSFAVKPLLLPSGTIGSTEVERRIIGGRREVLITDKTIFLRFFLVPKRRKNESIVKDE